MYGDTQLLRYQKNDQNQKPPSRLTCTCLILVSPSCERSKLYISMLQSAPINATKKYFPDLNVAHVPQNTNGINYQDLN